jgi:rhodanese-related sulfurtransferase
MTATATIPTTSRITPGELRQLIHEDASIRVLDVRTGGEFGGVHIPGSFNVPLDTLTEHARELADVDSRVVLVCQSGARATEAGQKLNAAGKDSLQVLDGGISAWESSGGDVVRGEERWGMERQVRLAAGAIAVTSVLASVIVPKAKWLAAGVGGGLAYSALSNTCTMGLVLAKLPYNQADGCDIEGVLSELNS